MFLLDWHMFYIVMQGKGRIWSQKQKNISCSEHFPAIYLSVGAEVFLFMLKNSF